MTAEGTTTSSGDAPPPPDKGILTRNYQGTLPPGVSMNEAYDEWLQYTWIEGGGLSLGPPPIIRETGEMVTGKGLCREIPPVGIQEKILTADRPSAVTYKVMNPGWATFQVHWHLGSVKWTKGATDADSIQVEWTVSVVPWFGFGWWVSLMVDVVVERILLANYIAHLKEKKEKEREQCTESENRKACEEQKASK